jgi:hypothetical protein
MKKVTAIIMVIILLINLASCHAYIDLAGQEEYKAYQDKKHVYVVDIQTYPYRRVNISESSPGKIINGEVISLQFHQVILPYCKTDTIIFENSKASYILKNGKMYKVIKQNKNGYTAMATDTIRIPFSDIKKMHIKETKPGESVLLALGIAGMSLGLVILIAYLTMDFSAGWSVI